MEQFTISELSSGNSDNTLPRIDDNNVVWQSTSENENDEIFFFNGSQTIQLTNNDVADIFPQISGNNIVWQSGNLGSETEIFFYDGNENIQLTDNDVADIFPRISGNNIVWQSGNLASETEIFLYDGSENIQLTDNDVPDNFPRISGNNVVWQGGADDAAEIFFYDGNETIQLTDNDVPDNFPRISGNNVVWQSGAGDAAEIFFYDGSETIQLTDNDVPDTFGPDSLASVLSLDNIIGDNVVWQSGSGDAVETFFYDGNETIQLSNDGEVDGDVANNAINDDIANDEFNLLALTVGSGNESEVFVYNGSEAIQLTDNDVPDNASGTSQGNLVFQRTDVSESGEEIVSLFLATPNNTNSGTTEAVYRFLNNDTGVYFYTADETEKETVSGLDNFSFEGASYNSADSLIEDIEATPVYRFFDRNTGMHFYTISETEREAVAGLDNFSFEGEAFTAYATEVEGTIPIYRFFDSNTGAHLYTPLVTERDDVEGMPGFQAEGIAYYVLPLEAGES